MTVLRALPLLLMALLLSQSALAHRFAPSLLKVTEVGEGQYNMVWKTPAQGTSNIPLKPEWPASCEITSASPVQMEGTGKVSSWQMQCTELGDDGKGNPCLRYLFTPKTGTHQ